MGAQPVAVLVCRGEWRLLLLAKAYYWCEDCSSRVTLMCVVRFHLNLADPVFAVSPTIFVIFRHVHCCGDSPAQPLVLRPNPGFPKAADEYEEVVWVRIGFLGF